ncbi:MAG: LysR family transcriptional regulator [Endozoicomonas sp.]
MNKLKQLPRLLVFAEVAHKGSFTQAARHLNITKSAVSQQIRALEQELNVQLLNRTTRGVAPTALGKQLLQRSQSLQEQVDLIFSDIASAGHNPSGRFAITFPHSLQSRVIMPALEQLCIEYPNLEPHLVASDQQLDLVSHNLDMAITCGDLPDSTYRALPIGSMTEVFCATPLYISRYGSPETLEQLAQSSCILTSWQKPVMYLQDKANGRASNSSSDNISSNSRVRVHMHPAAQVNTLASALEMVQRHFGIALLPDVIARPLISSGEVLAVLPDFTGPDWPVWSLHAYQQEKPVHVTRFHQLASRFFEIRNV